MASSSRTKDLVHASSGKLEPLPGESEGEKPKDLSEEAEKEWLEVMTEKADRAGGDPGVQFAVGQYHFSRQDYINALKYFEKAIGVRPAGNQSSSQAKYQLGVMYFDGLGVKESPVKGAEYMLQVAQSSEKRATHLVPSAQYNMGRAYFMGYGVTQSDSEAEKWWCSAASLGKDPSSLRASHTLGLFYSRQESRKLNESCRCHAQAAEGGNLESMAALGVMLIQGQGCDKNERKGLDWLKRSAVGGCVYGEGLLSRQYLAMKLYSKAVEAAFRVSEIEDLPPQGDDDTTTPLSRLDCIGVATGCFVLGRCLQLGNAVTKNEPKAMTYFEKAKQFDMGVTIELYDQLTHNQL